MIDQAVVSGASFLATILVGRWCGPGELGVYSLGFTLLVSWGCVQESLIALPYYRVSNPVMADYARYVIREVLTESHR